MLSERAREAIASARREWLVEQGYEGHELDGLPDWFAAYRPAQWEAVQQIMGEYRNGAKVIVLDAPTGSGKTLIAETVRRLLHTNKTLYVCSTKTLQDQFAEDFPYAAVLKGRSNYPTLSGGTTTAADCTKEAGEEGQPRLCLWCPSVHNCPYEMAKRDSLRSPLSVLNTAYFLTEANGPGRFSGAPFVVVDEADLLEHEIMGYTSIDIGPRRVQSLKLGEPHKITKKESWQEWVERAVPKVRAAIPMLTERSNVGQVRNWKALRSLYGSLLVLREGLENEEWVYTGREGRVSFKPVRVDGIGSQKLWNHGQRWLLMSATIISPNELMASLGCELPWSFVEMGSSFDVENRRVKIMPVANMSRKVYEKEKLADAVLAVLARHPDERVLLHTVSYDLSNYLRRELEQRCNRPVVAYTSADNRQAALQKYLREEHAVLIAPSFDRGVDLPDDACRVIIVAKCPFPYLGDRQVSARLHSPGGQTWYTVQTIRSLVQMTGRATRHSTDFSTSYALDSTIANVLQSSGRGLVPRWWAESLDWRDRLRL